MSAHTVRRRRSPAIELGVRANWRQFGLLIAVNAFVGAMVGLERTVLPILADAEFGVASKSAALSFIVTFGAVKAITNLFAGRLGDVYGRKAVLITGWLVGIPVPLLIIWAPSWSWIVFANVLLGINQGLAWSMTIVMKIDLAGPKQRGFAMGLNEFAGYLAVALSALATGYIAAEFGLRPAPFYLGIAFVACGIALTFLVRETRGHTVFEEQSHGPSPLLETGETDAGLRAMFARGSWRDPALSSASHAGMVNNMNDGLAWGLFPLFFGAAGLDLRTIGILAFIYPATWGVLQLWTGGLSDRVGRKALIAGGMFVQGAALAAIALGHGFWWWACAAALLGAGTAMVYPTLLAAIADVAHPRWRGSAVGVYRLWRDAGYAIGALMAGVTADLFGMSAALGLIALITAASGVLVVWRMPETLPRSARVTPPGGSR
jgi:MFS family permease